MTHRQRGFTVLEVLVALAIFVMIGVYLVAGYLNAMRAYQLAAEQDRDRTALAFARHQLLVQGDREKLREGGTFEDKGIQVRWQADAEPTAVPDVYRVTFTCDLSEPGKDARKVEETLQLLRPSWARPDEQGPVQQKLKERIKKYTDEVQSKRRL